MNPTMDESSRPRCVEQSISRLWPEATWSSAPLDDGMTNRNFRVEVTADDGHSRVVVVQEQLPPDLARSIGILRGNQMEVWPLAATWGLAPELIAAFDDIGTTVVQFVDGTRMTDYPNRAHAIALAARALHTLHSRTRGSALTGLVADAFDGTDWMFRQIVEVAPEKAAEFQWAMDLVERIRQARGPYERCLLHTDPSPVNIFVMPDHERVMLIDWEYVGTGDPLYELAYFAERIELVDDEEEHLLRSYDGQVDARRIAVFTAYRFVTMLREALWSVRAGMLGFLDFDHSTYEKFCMERMMATHRSPRFLQALDLLVREASQSGRAAE